MAELEVPAESYRLLDPWTLARHRATSVEQHIRAIATPVVVAELRRLCPGPLVTKAQIEARIAQLEAACRKPS